jgi:hypothetical protein
LKTLRPLKKNDPIAVTRYPCNPAGVLGSRFSTLEG